MAYLSIMICVKCLQKDVKLSLMQGVSKVCHRRAKFLLCDVSSTVSIEELRKEMSDFTILPLYHSRARETYIKS